MKISPPRKTTELNQEFFYTSLRENSRDGYRRDCPAIGISIIMEKSVLDDDSGTVGDRIISL